LTFKFTMRTHVFWFRSDLRLHDQRALATASRQCDRLLLVYVHEPMQDAQTRWGFKRMGEQRRQHLAQCLVDLEEQLRSMGQTLLLLRGPAEQALVACARASGATTVVCEDIAAPEEQAQVQALRRAGLSVQTVWQSSLLEPEDLPVAMGDLPPVFTAVRQAVECAGVLPHAPTPKPQALPPPPPIDLAQDNTAPVNDPHTLLGVKTPNQGMQHGGESAALTQLQRYLRPPWPDRYKQTRNALQGQHTSSHWSTGLATGALSPRRIWAELQTYEQTHGANDGTYWLWFELLWRDYFRFLHQQHGLGLYRAQGLSSLSAPTHPVALFERWRLGNTGERIVDAGMRELAMTGFTSNRMRQIVASYLVHDLACDGRAGAAWFEAMLIDYDVYSNQGNWLYLSGRGTDPRQGRRFNPQKQSQEHDPHGHYQERWLGSKT
jgi:deoxyribodipyrimidine photo-lyase